jgi:hypothetical protein
MIKSILKTIFPAVLLKSGFGIYNRIRILTVDKLLFPEFKIARNEFLFYREGFPFLENKIDSSDISDPEARNYMNQWNAWSQEEFILVLKRTCWIEPAFGWAIVPPSKLIYYSLGISRTWGQKKPNLKGLFVKKNRLILKRAISLRDSGEENYFHFYNDVLAKIFLLQEHNVEVLNVPVIVARKLWDAPFFQYYLQHSSFFASLQWIIQDKQFIKCEEVVFCKPLTHRKDLLRLVFAPIIRVGGGTRRIFVTRGKSRMRFIENADEIESICRTLNFEVIDTDLLPVHDQLDCFSNASWIIGIHGAALTNLFVREGCCHVLEIFPPPEDGYLPFHYIMLAKILGFRYECIIGQKGKRKYSGGFYLSPQLFKKCLQGFLGPQSPSGGPLTLATDNAG